MTGFVVQGHIFAEYGVESYRTCGAGQGVVVVDDPLWDTKQIPKQQDKSSRHQNKAGIYERGFCLMSLLLLLLAKNKNWYFLIKTMFCANDETKTWNNFKPTACICTCSHINICHMSTASDILRPGYRTLVCSSIWLVDVVNVEKQICAIRCWAGTAHLDSFRVNEGSKFHSAQFLENPSSSPASQPTVLHFTAQLETAALRHKLCSTTCSNRLAQFTYWNENETNELGFLLHKALLDFIQTV